MNYLSRKVLCGIETNLNDKKSNISSMHHCFSEGVNLMRATNEDLVY